jgi:hypothetical protein
VVTAIPRIPFWDLAGLLILGVIVLFCGFSFMTSVRKDGPLSFESHWGGLGGGVGGWRMSESLTYLMATIVFGVLFLVLAEHHDGGGEKTTVQAGGAVVVKSSSLAGPAAQITPAVPPSAVAPAAKKSESSTAMAGEVEKK